MAIILLITDQLLNVVGDPLGGWTDLQCDLTFNAPASGHVTLPAYPEVMAQLQPGNRIVLIRDGEIWCAGPLEIPQDFQWAVGGASGGDEPEPGKVTLNFTDDLGRVAGYLTYPDPSLPFNNQPASAPRTITATNAEVIIRTLVAENCGPNALAARRIGSLVLDSITGVGTATSITTRFDPLLEVCRTVASRDGLGFRTRQVGTQIRFGAYAPTDRTATARFSKGLGNLRAVSFKLSAPTVTSALVQGGNETTHTYVQVTDTAAETSWYRVEKLVDKGDIANDSNGELTQAGNEELASGAAPVELTTVTVDTHDLKAGQDFGLGDKVTIELPTGVEVADLVRSIRLQADPKSGELVTSVVGSADATTDPLIVRTVRELAKRLGRLETR